MYLPLEIRIKRQKFRTLFAIMTACAGALLWLMLYLLKRRNNGESIESVPIGLTGLGLLIFSLLAAYFLKQLLDRKPALLIDESGIHDNYTFPGVKFVGWENVTEIGRRSYTGVNYILVYVKNTEKYTTHERHILRKKSAAFNMDMFGSPILILASGLELNIDDIFGEMRKAKANYDGRRL